MPGDSGIIEMSAYWSLQHLYWLYAHSGVDKIAAQTEVCRLKTTYGSACRVYEMFCEEAHRYSRITGMLSDIEKHGSEDAKRLIRIMDGRERIIDEPDTNDGQEYSYQQITMPELSE